jgi:hypothetical protein
VVHYRNPKVALRHTGLRAALQAMAPADMGRAGLALVRAMGMSKARESALTQWEKFFQSKGMEAVYPLTTMNVLGFIWNYVGVKGNHSHVLPGAISCLRRAAQLNDLWDIDAEGEAAIAETIKTAKKVLPSRAKVSEAIDIDELLVLMEELYLEAGPASARLGAMIASVANFKMRGTEVYGPKGIRRGDIKIQPEGVIFSCVLSKTSMDSLVPRPRAAPHLTESCALLCASFWLKRYLKAVDPQGTMPAGNPLFCTLGKGGRWSVHAPSAETEGAAIFARMEAVGIATGGLNIEWGRHTGESLHQFKCGLDPATSDLLGDHANRQSVGVTHYTHPEGQGGNILIVGANKIKAYAATTAAGEICCQ